MNKLIQKKCPLIKPLQFIISKYLTETKIKIHPWKWPNRKHSDIIRLIVTRNKIKRYEMGINTIGRGVGTLFCKLSIDTKITIDLDLSGFFNLTFIPANKSVLIIDINNKKIKWIYDGETKFIPFCNFTIEDNTMDHY
jgi:hypothetical protein